MTIQQNLEEFRKKARELKQAIRTEYPRLARMADWGERRFSWFNLLVFFMAVMWVLALTGVLKTHP